MISDKEARDLARVALLCDQSVAPLTGVAVWISLAWLLIGSVFGLIASLMFNFPDLLAATAWLSWGRSRPAHLNTMVYGWASTAMMFMSLWLTSRLVRTPLRWAKGAATGIVVWNLGVAIGVIGLLNGVTDGMEWLELDRTLADPIMFIGAAFVAASLWKTIHVSRIRHFYVSIWYLAAAFIWFPFIFALGNWTNRIGVENAAVNWFYAHNALGLWFTPINLAAIYYLIPKIIGRPIYSYWLSLLGFWALAFFYSLNGMHHLIGGPLPSWMITSSIVASVMMVIPVLAVAVNHHMTIVGRFSALRYSPTLSFVVLGAMSYTGVSLQGSMQSAVEVNRVTHFTQWTIGHAHMGVYAFATLSIFGTLYYILPRMFEREWPSARLIRWHFWLVLVGIFLYIFGLGIAGVLQGLVINASVGPFQQSIEVLKPWLWVRTIAGFMLTGGHCVFAYHVYWLASEKARRREIPAWHEIAPLVIDSSSIQTPKMEATR